MSIKLRKRKLSNGEYALYLDIYNNGKRYYEFLKLRLTKNPSENKEIKNKAEVILSQRRIELESQEYGLIPGFRRKNNFVTYFEEQVNKRPPDRSAWKCTLKKLKTFTGGKITFAEINEEWLREFQNYLLNSKIKQVTAHHYYSNLRTALNQAVKEKILASNPCLLLKGIKKPETQRSFLTELEISKLVEARCANAEVKLGFLFSCFTGLRLADVRNLSWGQIKNGQIDYMQQKTKRFEYLPLSESANKILKIKLANNIRFLPEVKVFNLPSKPTISTNIKNWAKAAEIEKDFSFHSARHTFATLSLSSGTSLYDVSKLLGHKEISTTQIYAKVIDAKMKEAVDRLPIINI